MKMNLLNRFTLFFLFFSFTLTASAASLFSPSHRSDRMQVSFQIRDVDPINMTTDKDVEIDVNGTVGWAFGVGYNFTENWEFNFDIAWSDASYSATFTDTNGDPKAYSNRIYSSTTNFAATYNFTNKRLTPYVGASVGWAFVDSNIRDGRDGVYCDPFYYYYCYSYTPTKNTTEFTYGAQAGLRFDANNQLFFKLGVDNQWIDFSNVKSAPSATVYRFEVGFMF